jgi:hypothetical protein
LLIDRDELYDRVTDEYVQIKGVSLENQDSVAASVMDVVFSFLRERGLLIERVDEMDW